MGRFSRLKRLYHTLHFHCSVSLVLLFTSAFVNLICILSSNLIFLLPALSFASERASSSPYVLHFYALVSHPTPSRFLWALHLDLPFLDYSSHTDTIISIRAQSLVPTALSIPSSCSPGVSFSEPDQDLSLNPQGSGIGGNPGASLAHDLTVHLQTLRQTEAVCRGGHCSYVLSCFRVF